MEFKRDIEKEFYNVKSAIHNKEEPVLSSYHKQWLEKLTTDILQFTAALPRDSVGAPVEATAEIIQSFL